MENKPDHPKFEDHYEEIATIVEKHRSKWTFKASVMKDFDDVKSEIITHIWKKWHLFDPTRALGGWVATITKHQFSNILRNVYLSTSSPCSQCPCSRDDNKCSLFGVQSVECALYAKWSKTKKSAHEARLPVSLEHHMDEIINKPDCQSDLEPAIDGMHAKIKEGLTVKEWEIYRRKFISNMGSEEIADELKFKTSERGRRGGYKRIRQVELRAIAISKQILAKHGIEGMT